MSEAPKTARSTETGSSRADRVKRLGDLRDGILVAGGTLYVLGYVVWSLHAWDEGLGLLPALELQYLLAGSLLALFLLFAALLGIAGVRLAVASEGWRSSHRSVRLLAALTPYLVGAVPATLAMGLLVVAGLEMIWAGVAAMVFGGVIIAFASASERLPGLKRFERPGIALILGGFIAWAATSFYLAIVYPNVPQELGGVRPRCSYVEVARADTSGLLRQELFTAAQTNGGIARSRRLSIFFSGGEAYIVRARGVEGAHTYELRKEIVKSVSDC